MKNRMFSYLICLLVAGFLCMGKRTQAATVTVTFQDFSFNPKVVTINVGDTVFFSNGGGSHTVTGTGSDPICGSGGISTSCSHTFNTAGSFPYVCIPHQGLSMTGQVIVASVSLPPTVSITNPANAAVFAVAPTNILIQASASGNGGATVTNVQFFNGANLIGSSTGPSAFSATFSSVAAGSYSLTAIAKDNHGLSKTSSVVSITVNAAPSVSITSPTAGAVFPAPATFTIQGTGSDTDGSVTNVQVLLDSATLSNAASASFSVIASNVVAGSHTVFAIASDNRGVKTTNSVNVVVNALPSVSITNPSAGSKFMAPFSGSIQANAADSDGTVNLVSFFANGNSLGNSSGPTFSIAVTNLVAGNYALTVQATDNRGAVTTSGVVNVSVITNATVGIPQKGTNGFQFAFATIANQTYVVEASTNLSATNGWIPVSTNTPSGSSGNFLDLNALSLSNRFYRVKSQ